MFGDPAALGGKKATYDLYNNVVYDWGDWAVAGFGVARVSVENNYFQLGRARSATPSV